MGTTLQLTTGELGDFQRLNKIVTKGIGAFVETGRALMEIRTRKLYRDEYGTFEEYAKRRHELSKPYAYQLIDAAEIVNELSAIADVLPKTESQCHELTCVPSKDLPGVWTTICEQSKEDDVDITAKYIRKHVEPFRAPLTSTLPQQIHNEDNGEITTGNLHDLITQGKRFSCIYADPPWQYGNQSTRGSTDDHYPTMTLDDIAAEPVAELAAENCHLHLWTTNAFLFEAKAVMDTWGFTYKSMLIWVKPQMGMGNYWRVSHEILLLGIKGRAPFNVRNQKSWIEADRTKHSRKPRVVREMIEKVSSGPFLEMYGREQIEGWTVYGNQINAIAEEAA